MTEAVNDALDLLQDLIGRARRAGADAADAVLFEGTSLSHARRLGKTEEGLVPVRARRVRVARHLVNCTERTVGVLVSTPAGPDRLRDCWLSRRAPGSGRLADVERDPGSAIGCAKRPGFRRSVTGIRNRLQ